MKKFTFLIFCLLIIGCTSPLAQLEEQWIGRDRNSLIAVKGTPDQTMDNGLGGQIYTYVEIGSFTLSESATTKPPGGIWTSKYGWQYDGAETTYIAPQTFTTKTKNMFWINSAGEIYKVSITR